MEPKETSELEEAMRTEIAGHMPMPLRSSYAMPGTMLRRGRY